VKPILSINSIYDESKNDKSETKHGSKARKQFEEILSAIFSVK
jgi:hypothetical protein